MARRIEDESGAGGATPPGRDGTRRLQPIADFGSNPGRLAMWAYRPASAGPAPALVVVLHGCLQTVAQYDAGSGWSRLADEAGFVVLYPEQQRRNNPRLCFDWFSRGHSQRERGQAESIRQMIATAIALTGADPARVHVTGLSAGGAMAAVMLASYPEIFSAGAIVAGLPYRAATTLRGAVDAMASGTKRSAEDLAGLVRAAAPEGGPWPRIAVWHGSDDRVVVPANAEDLLAQWRGVHGLAAEPDGDERLGALRRRQWTGADGSIVLEDNRIAGLGHGTPVDQPRGRGVAGPGPFFLEAGISSTREIARFFGLVEARAVTARTPAGRPARIGPVSAFLGALGRLMSRLR